MLTVRFDRDRAQEFFECLKQDRPIEVPEGGWKLCEVELLAGVALFVAVGVDAILCDESNITNEFKEARRTSRLDEFGGGIKLLSILAASLFCGNFDQHYERIVELAVRVDAEGEQQVTMLRGWKPGGREATASS